MESLILNGKISARDPRQVEQFAQETAELIDRPIRRASIVQTGAAGDVITVRIQIKNRRKYDIAGVHSVLLWIGTASGGAPAGTQTVAFTSGTVLSSLTANRAWEMLTDSTGKIVLEITVTGAGTRYVNAQVRGPSDLGTALVWT